jgi:hypothetical protein
MRPPIELRAKKPPTQPGRAMRAADAARYRQCIQKLSGFDGLENNLTAQSVGILGQYI